MIPVLDKFKPYTQEGIEYIEESMDSIAMEIADGLESQVREQIKNYHPERGDTINVKVDFTYPGVDEVLLNQLGRMAASEISQRIMENPTKGKPEELSFNWELPF